MNIFLSAKGSLARAGEAEEGAWRKGGTGGPGAMEERSGRPHPEKG